MGRPKPKNANTAVAGYVSRLRKVLAASDVTITRRSTGYLLDVDPAAVDLLRFRGLIDEAKAAGDAEKKVACLEQAVRLWRGEPFGPLDSPWLEEVRRCLAVSRLSAEAERFEIALAGGLHSQVLSDLLTASTAFPLDENLTRQLMLASYRSGHQADALRSFEKFERRLESELQAQPSCELLRLYKEIRAGASAALACVASVSGAASPATRVSPGRRS